MKRSTVISLVFLTICFSLFTMLIGWKSKSESGIVLSEAVRTRGLNPPKKDHHSKDLRIWDIHGIIEDYELLPPGDNNSYPIFILHFRDGRIIPMVIQGDPLIKGVEIIIYYKVWARNGSSSGSTSKLGNFAYEIRVEQ